MSLFDMVDPPAGRWAVSVTPEVSELLRHNAPVAIGVSGGKDSQAMALRLADYLEEVGHSGPVVCVHADLGRIEWRQSLPVSQRIAERIGLPLTVVRRESGDLLSRWQQRWENNVARYSSLSCVKLILPFSTAGMRFCTSEGKSEVISSFLTKTFPGQKIISAVGIRHEESPARAKMPVSSPQQRLKRRGCSGLQWHPIISWKACEVFDYIASKGESLHEAYTRYGCSRVSCSFCILGSLPDLKAAASCEDNAEVYRQVVALETISTFAFQGSRWLGDVAPELLSPEELEAHALAKQRAEARRLQEARIPNHLLYTSGWPQSIPSYDEAALLGEVRQAISDIVGIPVGYTKPGEIIGRYQWLMDSKNASLKKSLAQTAA